MCNVAVGLIDSKFLELPPRIYIGERKGQGVSVDLMAMISRHYKKLIRVNIFLLDELKIAVFSALA